jgi:hypothetical protein
MPTCTFCGDDHDDACCPDRDPQCAALAARRRQRRHRFDPAGRVAVSTEDDDPAADEIYRYAFEMKPQVRDDGDEWTASYPGADWSVSGRSREDALHNLGEEFKRKQNAGEDALAYADDVYRRHLREPVEGVYAVDNELYRQLIDAPAAERDRVVKEAERRRRLGQIYTLADYRRDSHE